MRVIKPPQPISGLEQLTAKNPWALPKIFLAGSIEMGKAIDWQAKFASLLEREGVILLNPRRDDWDSSWKQEMSNPQFREQVEWELQAMEIADMIVMYFDPKTKSPITLLELGLHAKSKKLCVCCPKGFWRKGNVDIVCARYGTATVDTIEGLALFIQQNLTAKAIMGPRWPGYFIDQANASPALARDNPDSTETP